MPKRLPRRLRGVRPAEIDTLEGLARHLRRYRSLDRVVAQGLDLREAPWPERLREYGGTGAFFLGCRLAPETEAHLHDTGAEILTSFDGPQFERAFGGPLPFDPFRNRLYTADELMAGYDEAVEAGEPHPLACTLDARIYAHFAHHHHAEAPPPVLDALAQRLHDHAIDDALFDVLHPASGPERRVVGIMGGHALRRTDAAFADVARLAWTLARGGYFLASGGGPGAMEATNLGAYLSTHDDPAVLEEAIGILREAPSYTDAGYLATAYAVRARFPEHAESLAIPTWFYGHEPTNLFATHVAKFFANSLREDGLLAIATHGVIYAPGSAGTVQEVFMDAAQNHYVTFRVVSPMAFLGAAYWTETLPAWPLLRALAEGRPYADALLLEDDVDAIAQFIRDTPPFTPGPESA